MTLTLVCLLLQAEDVNRTLEGGRKPLHYAADCGHAEILEYLLSQGADVNVSAVAASPSAPPNAPLWRVYQRQGQLCRPMREIVGQRHRSIRMELNRHRSIRMELNRHRSNRVESKRHGSNRVESNRHRSNRVESNRHGSNRVELNRHRSNRVQLNRHRSYRVELNRHRSNRV